MAFIVYTNDKGDVTNNYVMTKLNHKMQYHNYAIMLLKLSQIVSMTQSVMQIGIMLMQLFSVRRSGNIVRDKISISDYDGVFQS